MDPNIAQNVAPRTRAERGRRPLPASRQIRVAAAENSYVIREFLADALSWASQTELVALCCDGAELECAIATWHPDVVVTDVRMPPAPGNEGIRVAARLREAAPQAGVVVLSQEADPACALALFERGSRRRAYLLKERIRNRRELLGVIETVARGDSYIDPMVVDLLIQDQSRPARSRLSQLTPREQELLAAVATGKSDAAIADSLFLAKGAVETQVRSILCKLGLPDSQDDSQRARGTLVFLAQERSNR